MAVCVIFNLLGLTVNSKGSQYLVVDKFQVLDIFIKRRGYFCTLFFYFVYFFGFCIEIFISILIH